jgi:ppGpp synthetase/RelA/SpoT-type nucleotidyltranferase
MKYMNEIQIRILARRRKDITKLKELLEKQYAYVIQTGLYRNEKDPYPDGYRCYLTLIEEVKE